MDFLNLAKNRYSSRNYKTNPIEEEKLLKILEAGRIAPSAANLQPWIFIVLRNEEMKLRVASTYRKEWLRVAPVIILICGDHTKSWKRNDGKDHCDIDISIAIDHLTLEATSLGLATCWICNFDAKKCSEIMNLPTHLEPIALLPVAYPADSVDPERHCFQRKKLEEIVFWDNYKY